MFVDVLQNLKDVGSGDPTTMDNSSAPQSRSLLFNQVLSGYQPGQMVER
jgi:hypothetical protein